MVRIGFLLDSTRLQMQSTVRLTGVESGVRIGVALNDPIRG